MTRLVGEKPISSIPDSARNFAQLNEYKRKHAIKCASCGTELRLRYGKIKNLVKYSSSKSVTCYPCFQKSKSEVNDAIAALNARKAAMRKKK